MQLIFQEVGTRTPTMSIVDCEVATLWPVGNIFATCWPRHVQYDRDSIFIVVSLDSLMRIGRIRGDQAMSLRSKFCRLKIFQWIQDDARDWVIHVEHLHCLSWRLLLLLLLILYRLGFILRLGLIGVDLWLLLAICDRSRA